MPSIATLLKEIWAADSRWVLCYRANTDDYIMELIQGKDTYPYFRGSIIDEVVRKVWMTYYGAAQ